MDFVKSFILIQTLVVFTVVTEDMLTKTVVTNYGPLRGIQSYTLLQNRSYFSFKGIRFGKAPVGDLRFKAPQPVEPWEPSTLDAFDYGPSCYIADIDQVINPQNAQSEDCLFLNVFVPEQNVILVTSNYRVGAFGFMSLDTCEYSGNMGLKDQQLALKWVHENIEYFGGDKALITLFGQSAGAGSTHHHMLNTESRTYFRRAICMSGTIFNPMAFTKKNDLQRMYKVVNQLNQTIDQYDDLVSFLKKVPPQDLIAFTNGNDEETGEIIWKPKLETCTTNHPFLVQLPQQYYKNHYVDTDVMFGLTSVEALAFVEEKRKIPFVLAPELLERYDKDFNISVQFAGIAFPINSKQSRILQNAIRKFYFGDSPISAKSLFPFIRLISYMNFEYGNIKSVILQSMRSHNKTYFFRYSFTGILDLFRLATNITSLSYASHSDEQGYLFRVTKLDALYENVLATKDTDPLSAQALQNIIDMTTLYTSFAKTGVPIVNGNSAGSLLEITNGGILRTNYSHLDEYHFWARLEKLAKKMQMEGK